MHPGSLSQPAKQAVTPPPPSLTLANVVPTLSCAQLISQYAPFASVYVPLRPDGFESPSVHVGAGAHDSVGVASPAAGDEEDEFAGTIGRIGRTTSLLASALPKSAAAASAERHDDALIFEV